MGLYGGWHKNFNKFGHSNPTGASRYYRPRGLQLCHPPYMSVTKYTYVCTFRYVYMYACMHVLGRLVLSLHGETAVFKFDKYCITNWRR